MGGKGPAAPAHSWEPEGWGLALLAQASIERQNGIDPVLRAKIDELFPLCMRRLAERRGSRFNVAAAVATKRESMLLSGRTHFPVEELVVRLEEYLITS